MAISPSLPLPPPELAARVGTRAGEDPVEWYLREGARLRTLIEELLPGDWRWEGKRALDFGCGSARVLRHFAPEAALAEFHGCDIHAETVAWNAAKLSPPFHFFVNGLNPPLKLSDGSIDLIWAMSVFTHITDVWSSWLLEMHRLLAQGGILVASFLGAGMWPAQVGEPYREDELGMAVLHHWEGPDAWVYHSEWWLREHWGRAFEVLTVRQPSVNANGDHEITHSYVALRRRDGAITAAELERIAPTAREVAGLRTALRLARSEQLLLSARALRAQEEVAGAPHRRKRRLGPLRDTLLRRA